MTSAQQIGSTVRFVYDDNSCEETEITIQTYNDLPSSIRIQQTGTCVTLHKEDWPIIKAQVDALFAIIEEEK